MKPKSFVGVFKSDHDLLAAAQAARKKGLVMRDAYTPYPVHGMDQALGLPPSWLPRACFALGAAGLALALAFQYWVSIFDWPMNIGGKPFDASPALIPIAFEITVLVSGVGTVLILLAFRGLFPGRLARVSGLGATDDKFLLVIDAQDEEALLKFFEEHRVVEIKELGGGRQ
mgnify:CR=1 FL=1